MDFTQQRLTFTVFGTYTIELWRDAPMAFSVRTLQDGMEALDARAMYTTETSARIYFERLQECSA